MKTVLFLCTGNYYRSRYAEILFNSLAKKQHLEWRAVSRGLAPDPRNPGPMSKHTMAALLEQQIAFDSDLRFPLMVTDSDFESSDRIVAVKEAEHRPLIRQMFSHWLDRVEFWGVDDLDCSGPEVAIPHLGREVAGLILRVSAEG